MPSKRSFCRLRDIEKTGRQRRLWSDLSDVAVRILPTADAPAPAVGETPLPDTSRMR